MLLTLAEGLGIVRPAGETDAAFYNRVCYSAISRWMLIAAAETRDGECGTVMHVKQEAMNKLSGLEKAMEGLLNLTDSNIRQIVDWLWSCHEAAGTFYREPYRVTAAIRQTFSADGAILIRSPGLYEVCQSSGAGFYHIGNEANSKSIEEGFGLLSEAPEDLLNRLEASDDWMTERIEGWSHYFNSSHHHGQMFYDTKRPREHTILVKETIGFRYYLLSHGRQRCFTEWEQQEGLHWAAMCALQHRIGNLCATVKGKALISIQVNCRLPRRDEAIFQYCSWPCHPSEGTTHFKFKLAPALYPLLRRRLTLLGFAIREEET